MSGSPTAQLVTMQATPQSISYTLQRKYTHHCQYSCSRVQWESYWCEGRCGIGEVRCATLWGCPHIVSSVPYSCLHPHLSSYPSTFAHRLGICLHVLLYESWKSAATSSARPAWRLHKPILICMSYELAKSHTSADCMLPCLHIIKSSGMPLSRPKTNVTAYMYAL